MNNSKYIVDPNGERRAGCFGNAIRYGVGGGIIVGGKLSTGSDVENQNESFFNNVQFEYRLNKNSSQFLKMFYERDSYDWLEGNISEYGGGFIWRRKLQHFMDIFHWKDKKDTLPLPTPRRDSVNVVKTNKNETERNDSTSH